MTFIVNMARLRVPLRGLMFGVLAAGVFLAAGCSDDQPECKTAPEGQFAMSVTVSDDPIAFTGAMTFPCSVEVAESRFTDPPTLYYQLRRTDDRRVVRVEVTDNGFALPFDVGSLYTVTLERRIYPGTVVVTYGIVIRDDAGLLHLAASDLSPNETVFTEGFADLDLQVFVQDPDCKPRVENTIDFRDITNRRLEFVLDGGTTNEARTRLFHTQSGRLGPWVVRVHKADRVVAKNAARIQNQVSFFLARGPVL